MRSRNGSLQIGWGSTAVPSEREKRPAAAGFPPASGASAQLPLRTRLRCRLAPPACPFTLTSATGGRKVGWGCIVLTVKQVAERLQVSLSTVYALCVTGELPHRRIGLGRGCIRIAESDLQEYLDRK